MNELELIQQLTRALPVNESVVVGAGDDCAVLDFGLADRLLLFKTDAVVQGIHFTDEAPPEKVGHKALGRCLSDIAAMAGTPSAALITIGLPREFDPGYVQRIYAGMGALARRYRVAIAGGETTASPERIFISVALLGFVARGKCVLRSGAKVGDGIFVTDELGGSLAGKHLEFEPRLNEARWLLENFSVHSMIDVSDGLAGDLRHLLHASGAGAEILSTAIPISRAARECRLASSKGPFSDGSASRPNRANESPAQPGGRKSPLMAALTDGEDFELLFTVASKEAVPLFDRWKEQFPDLRLSCVGKVTAGPGITIRDKDGARPLTDHGYVHFA